MLFAQRRQLHHVVAELFEQNIFGVPAYAKIAHYRCAADEIPKAAQYLERQASMPANLEITRKSAASLTHHWC